uniref:Transmembrane protein 42 n=1 Tax=Eptatretus burgeri TaxID=7764 RepID=A0A8C4QTK8_EPTBU
MCFYIFLFQVNISCRLLLFACMLGTNAIMCTLFAKALHYSSNTLWPTLTSTAINFMCSAVFGRVLFGEVLSFMWWIGAAFVLMGLALVHSASLDNAADIEKRKVM